MFEIGDGILLDLPDDIPYKWLVSTSSSIQGLTRSSGLRNDYLFLIMPSDLLQSHLLIYQRPKLAQARQQPPFGSQFQSHSKFSQESPFNAEVDKPPTFILFHCPYRLHMSLSHNKQAPKGRRLAMVHIRSVSVHCLGIRKHNIPTIRFRSGGISESKSRSQRRSPR